MPPVLDSISAARAMAKRDGASFYDDDFWWTQQGQVTRWAIFGGLFVALLSYIVLGHVHARRRLARGLPPLAYHRWLLSKRERARFDPRLQSPPPSDPYYNPDGYGMHAYPPPVYDPNSAPPSYQPPMGASKVDPSQGRTEASARPASNGEPSPEYQPPPGPPPSHELHANPTGSSSNSNNPFRQ